MSAPAWGPAPAGAGTRFALWAPGARRLALRAGGRDRPMAPAGGGWFTLEAPDLGPGTAYGFVLEDGTAVPDPAARQQEGGVHGASVVPGRGGFAWRHDWAGRPWEEAVICEIHIGSFTAAGTFAAAAGRLDWLAAQGFTAIEVMPVAQFPGRRGWGYDGVLPYAVHPAYGTPDDFRGFVDAAHGAGLMVLLDVVYNHFGPEGNYLHLYAPDFFDPARRTPWGAAIAYDRAPVRRFFIDNARYWLEEFRLDGLRLDAIDHVRDATDPEILVELARELRAALPGRHLHLTTEDNRNITRLHERGPDGAPALYTAEWNDDWHNAAHVIATGETDGYYADFARAPHRLLARALAEGFAWQGETAASGRARGAPSAHLPPASFVDFLQNHDQIGNRALGERLAALAPAPAVAALQAMLLLSPHVPLLFMGEEYGETRPFLFFTDFHGDLARAVREGRRAEFEGFAGFAGDTARIPDPNDPATFAASKLDWARRETPPGRAASARLRHLLALRRAHVVPHLAAAGPRAGRVLEAPAGGIAVDWDLAGVRLQLRSNLSDLPLRLPPVAGEVILDDPAGGETEPGKAEPGEAEPGEAEPGKAGAGAPARPWSVLVAVAR